MMKIEKNGDNLAKLESKVVEEERGLKKNKNKFAFKRL